MSTALTKVEPRQLPAAFREMPLALPEDASQELRDQFAMLLCILHGLTCNTFSPDVVALSLYHAEDMGKALGIPEDTIKQMMGNFARYSKAMRRRSPISKLFEDDEPRGTTKATRVDT